MKYYYLNEEKKPQGPYSESELVSFKQSGLINDETLAAAAGDSRWKPFSELFSKEEVECSIWNTELGNCPHCNELLIGASVPEICPHCGKALHGSGRGLWYAFVYALKNSLNYRGRATRTEFWGFYLFSYIISFAIGQFTNLCISEEQAEMQNALQELSETDSGFSELVSIIGDFLMNPSVIAVQCVSVLISLALFIPMIAVTARRLHDRGHNMAGLLIGIASYVAMSVFFVLMAVFCINNFESIAASNIALEESPVMSYFLLMCISSLVWLLVSVYLFIMMVLPGKPGANKYGPSTLFPRG